MKNQLFWCWYFQKALKRGQGGTPSHGPMGYPLPPPFSWVFNPQLVPFGPHLFPHLVPHLVPNWSPLGPHLVPFGPHLVPLGPHLVRFGFQHGFPVFLQKPIKINIFAFGTPQMVTKTLKNQHVSILERLGALLGPS